MAPLLHRWQAARRYRPAVAAFPRFPAMGRKAAAGGRFEADFRGIQRVPGHLLTAVFHIPSVRRYYKSLTL
jgi:hypothetical protein